MKNLKKKGFTIVELVIVIAVIAVLAAVLIPTFVNLTKRANLSADQVAVKNMNTILSSDEVLNGKPATVFDAQKVLKNNGVSDFNAFTSNSVYYWISSENIVILWDSEAMKVTYPESMVKKFKDISEPSTAWELLNKVFDDTNYIEIETGENQNLKDALLNAVENAKDGAILKLPKDSNVELAQGGLYWLGESIKNEGGTGKDITIDLNGSTLCSTGANAVLTKNSDGSWRKDGADYVMNILTVPVNGELTLVNGNINIEHGEQPSLASIMATSGSKLVVNNIIMNTTTAGIMPAGDASEVVIENSTINARNFALGTNRMESSNIKVTIDKSNLSVTHSTAVLINTQSDTHIYESTITGVVHGIALRAGALIVENSTIITTDTNPGIFSYKNFAQGYNFNGYWGTGNTIPGGTLVLGDYAEANPDGTYSYSGNVNCTLINSKIQSESSSEIPEILLASLDPAKLVSLVYDEASTVGNIKVYGEDWTPTGDNISVVISHKGTIKVNNVKRD